MDGWAKIKQASGYAGVSQRSFRNWLKKGLRHSRLETGTILIKAEWIDEFLESFEIKENQVDAIVSEILGRQKEGKFWK